MGQNFLLYVDTADMRQVEVEHDCIWKLVFEQTESAEPVAGDQYFEALHSQRVLVHLARGAVIFDHENGWAFVSRHISAETYSWATAAPYRVSVALS